MTSAEPTIICPKCKAEIKLTESLAAPLVESIRLDYEKRLTQKDADMARRETMLREREAAMAKARESLALAKATRIPDIAVSVGISRFEEDGTQAGTMGLSLPLPLFDRNSGGIVSTKHQARRAEYEQRAARLRAATGLVEAYGRLETAKTEALATKAELLPGAQQAFDAAQTGYREGKYGHLEVLDTQRTLNEAKTRYLDVLAAYHKAAADVERLIGAPLNTIQ